MYSKSFNICNFDELTFFYVWNFNKLPTLNIPIIYGVKNHNNVQKRWFYCFKENEIEIKDTLLKNNFKDYGINMNSSLQDYIQIFFLKPIKRMQTKQGCYNVLFQQILAEKKRILLDEYVKEILSNFKRLPKKKHDHVEFGLHLIKKCFYNIKSSSELIEFVDETIRSFMNNQQNGDYDCEKIKTIINCIKEYKD